MTGHSRENDGAMSSDERKPDDDQAGNLDPASILSGWRDAFRT
ncbi:MAG: hypothetical protein RL477_671, partial [Pseudomonadota bacterium]